MQTRRYQCVDCEDTGLVDVSGFGDFDVCDCKTEPLPRKEVEDSDE